MNEMKLYKDIKEMNILKKMVNLKVLEVQMEEK